jgi:hypothetical protein
MAAPMSSFAVIQRGSEGLLHLDAYGDRGFCIYGLLTRNSSDKRCRDEKIALVTGTNRLLGRQGGERRDRRTVFR